MNNATIAGQTQDERSTSTVPAWKIAAWLGTFPTFAEVSPSTRARVVDFFRHVDALPSDEAAAVWECIDTALNGQGES